MMTWAAKEVVNLLSALFFFVPRTVWPQKSIGTGGESAMYEGYPFINISSPLPSEFYVDFGMVGLVVLSTLFGSSSDYAMTISCTPRHIGSVGQVFFATVAGYIFIILRGSLVGTLGPNIVLSLAIIGICYRYCTVPVATS